MRPRALKAAFVLAAALACTGCGSSGSSELPPEASDVVASTASATPATTSPAAGRTTTPGALVLDEASGGRDFGVQVGDLITVDLPSDYVQPTSSGAALRRESGTGGYPSAEPVRARFVATAAGSAELSASTDHACLHTEPRCMLPQRQWVARVHVTR